MKSCVAFSIVYLTLFCFLAEVQPVDQNGEAMAQIEKLSWLKGTWNSTHSYGCYPGIEPFTFTERLVISQPKGCPYFTWLSDTIKDDGSMTPMHKEYGFLRFGENETVVLQLAHSFGMNTIEEGSYYDQPTLQRKFPGHVDVKEKEVQLESTSMVHYLDDERRKEKYPRKQLKIMRRFIRFYEEGVFEQVIHMATDSVEMTKHLNIIYHRVAKDGDRSNFGHAYPLKDEKPNRTHELEWVTVKTTKADFVEPNVGKSTRKAEFKIFHPDDSQNDG